MRARGERERSGGRMRFGMRQRGEGRDVLRAARISSAHPFLSFVQDYSPDHPSIPRLLSSLGHACGGEQAWRLMWRPPDARYLHTIYTQGNLKSTRKARQSPFLSLYFWHKLIRLEQMNMKGRRWLQIEPVPSHGLCYQSRREGRKLDCSSPLLLGRNCSSLVTVTMTGDLLNLQPPLPLIFLAAV